MLRKQKIVLCLGSSCFARGNRSLVEVVRKYILRHNLEDSVEFKADHCFEQCSLGPNILINGRLYQQVTPENIEAYLDEGLKIP